MPFGHDTHSCRLLPLLLGLPSGAVVGVPADLRASFPHLDEELGAFGSMTRREGELRHAVHRTPPRIVLDLTGLATPLVEVALPRLRSAGAVVALLSGDRGLLARRAERVLGHDGKGLGWVASEMASAGRCLEIRIQPASLTRAERIRIPLPSVGGAEAALAAARAEGLRVFESRIVYDRQLAR